MPAPASTPQPEALDAIKEAERDAVRAAWAARRPPGTLPAEPGAIRGLNLPPLKDGLLMSDIVSENRE